MEQVIKDFAKYIDYLVLANDVDPDYPVMHTFAVRNKLNTEEHAFLCFLFSIVDNSTIAMQFFKKLGGWPVSREKHLKFEQWWIDNVRKFRYGKERLRNFGNTLEHLRKYIEEFTNTGQLGAYDLMFKECKDNDFDRYHFVSEYLSSIPYFGTLTKYDYLELLQRSLRLPIEPSKLATVEAGCFGPMNATEVILSKVQDTKYGSFTRPAKSSKHPEIQFNFLGSPSFDPARGKRDYSAFLEEQSRFITKEVAKIRDHRGNDVSLIESCLCKFQKFLESRYYVGWEIDEALGEVYDYYANFPKEFDLKEAHSLREETFLPCFLKEQRYGNDEELLRSYKKIKPRHVYTHFMEIQDGLYDDILFAGDSLYDRFKRLTPVQKYFLDKHILEN